MSGFIIFGKLESNNKKIKLLFCLNNNNIQRLQLLEIIGI